jgi:hypothetical protein
MARSLNPDEQKEIIARGPAALGMNVGGGPGQPMPATVPER